MLLLGLRKAALVGGQVTKRSVLPWDVADAMAHELQMEGVMHVSSVRASECMKQAGIRGLAGTPMAAAPDVLAVASDTLNTHSTGKAHEQLASLALCLATPEDAPEESRTSGGGALRAAGSSSSSAVESRVASSNSSLLSRGLASGGGSNMPRGAAAAEAFRGVRATSGSGLFEFETEELLLLEAAAAEHYTVITARCLQTEQVLAAAAAVRRRRRRRLMGVLRSSRETAAVALQAVSALSSRDQDALSSRDQE